MPNECNYMSEAANKDIFLAKCFPVMNMRLIAHFIYCIYITLQLYRY